LRCLERPDRQIRGHRINWNQRLGTGQDLGRLVLVAIAADALINAVVLLFDPAVEARGGRALRRARTGDGLSCRSQIIFVQKSCGSVPGSRVRASLSSNQSDSGNSRAQERNKKRFRHSVLP
jgi:hypothetical protein